MHEPAITPELVAKHNLTPEEYQKILGILGRAPSYTELGIFSVMWSEHCSYKNTRPVLKTVPTKGDKILVGAGEENAGIIDVGDGVAIAFKRRFRKSKKASTSNWGTRFLSDRQILYAANDAYAAYRVWESLHLSNTDAF
jgi:hypothetical protein